ncbi:MAG: lysyl oxidase family protein [Actinomycetota bacterium]
MRTRVLRLVFALAIASGLILLPGASSTARATLPSIGLKSLVHHTEVFRFPGDPLFLPGGIFLASTNGAFELWASALPGGGVDVRQMLRKSGQAPSEIRHLPFDPENSFGFGLARFLKLTWQDESGATIVDQDVPFCPASWDVTRTNDTGPAQPTYPQFCGSQLTERMVWGVDAGWAVGALSSAFVEDPGLADGTYTLRVAINESYANFFEIPAAQRSHSLSVTLITFEDPGPCFPGEPCAVGRTPAVEHGQTGSGRANPPRIPPNANGLPDLIALPAFELVTFNEGGADLLAFGANVWNAGPGPLVVEGFRTGEEMVMPATQYFFTDGKITGKAPVGAFHFHDAPDHFHWHFEDFAGYQLLDLNQSTVVTSGKQSFCLAPTDPIDLTAPGATWQPERIGFFSNCGFSESIWIREVMPAGWGDTYFQFVSGQSFDITTVPNGEYFVRVVTNAAQNLKETNYDNNESLRQIKLGGRLGHRTVQIL